MLNFLCGLLHVTPQLWLLSMPSWPNRAQATMVLQPHFSFRNIDFCCGVIPSWLPIIISSCLVWKGFEAAAVDFVWVVTISGYDYGSTWVALPRIFILSFNIHDCFSRSIWSSGYTRFTQVSFPRWTSHITEYCLTAVQSLSIQVNVELWKQLTFFVGNTVVLWELLTALGQP